MLIALEKDLLYARRGDGRGLLLRVPFTRVIHIIFPAPNSGLRGIEINYMGGVLIQS